MWIQSEKDKQNILKEEKKLLGLEAEEEDYKTMEEVAPKKRKKIRRK